MGNKFSRSVDRWNKDRRWSSNHTAASGRLLQFAREYSEWQYVNSMAGRVLVCLIPSVLLLIALWFASVGDRAFEIMIYPVGLVAYPLSLIQLVLLFVLWRSIKKYKSIVQKGYSTPTAKEVVAARNDKHLIDKYVANQPSPVIS
ncbi:MAG: hypothetical protein ACJ0RQ_03715 [Candidatus Azotimanducaceae bacterium]